MRTRNLAIMFTDIKGYTERTSQASHAETRSLLRRHAKVVVPVIDGFDGKIIKEIGDAFLVVFKTPTAAVQCGMTIQDALHRYNHELQPQDQIHLRVAVNIGEVLVSGGDVFGEPVNVASRVEGITPAKEVYFTEAVYLTMNRNEVRAERVGSFELKGVREPVVVYRVQPITAPRAEGTVSAEHPVIKDGTEAMAPSAPVTRVLTLPFGGAHLARLESQWLTPARRRLITAGAVAGVALLTALVTLPGYLRGQEWERIEKLIGRGETEAASNALLSATGGDADHERHFQLGAQLLERMVDRQEAARAVGVLSQLEPRSPEEKARYVRLESAVVDALLKAGNTTAASRVVEELRQKGAADGDVLFRQRTALSNVLLERGRLEELQTQVKLLMEQDAKAPVAHLLKGHLGFALATREDRNANMIRGLQSYREALEQDLSVGDDARLKTNVATSYNPPEPRRALELASAADQLVERYLKLRVLNALVAQLDQPIANKDIRDRLASRIQQLGGEKEVDRVKLLVTDLQSTPCTGGGVAASARLMERLREEAGTDPRALGALLRVAQRHDACEKNAMDALHRMVGERLGFVGPDETRLRDTLDHLKRSDCQKKAAQQETETLLTELARLGDLRAMGAILQVAATQEDCREVALKTAETLLGKRMAFESPQETRFLEVLSTLRTRSCSGATRVVLEDGIRAASRIGDRRLAGELLALAQKKDACSEAALTAARTVLKNESLALTCVDPRWHNLRARKCGSRKEAAALKVTVDELVDEGEARAVGELLALAARKNACQDVALAGARALLKNDTLGFIPPAPATPHPAEPAPTP